MTGRDSADDRKEETLILEPELLSPFQSPPSSLSLPARYDRQNTFRRMDDCLFTTAMGPPGGGRNNVTSRYTRHFSMLSIVDFDDATLKRIFSTILDWALQSAEFPANIKVEID